MKEMPPFGFTERFEKWVCTTLTFKSWAEEFDQSIARKAHSVQVFT